jgi:hypothetical protein
MREALKKLRIQYYSIYVAAVAMAVGGFQLFKAGLNIDEKSQPGVAISSILIILIIGSIPLTLSIFNKKLKKWNTVEDIAMRIKLYQKGSSIRISIIGTGFILGILFFFLMHSQSMIFCAGIAAIALFFCKPAEVKLIADLQIEEPDKY